MAALPKAAFFTAAVLLLSIATLTQSMRMRKWIVPRRSVVIALSLLVLFTLLSSLLSAFPTESLRGGYARGLGFIDLIVLTLFGWCVFLLFSEDQLRNVGWAITLAGGLAVLPGLWGIAQGAVDIRAAMAGTMGHPNFLGQLLTLTVPMTTALLLTETSRLRFLVMLLITLQCAGLLMTGSRAALLGAIIGVGLLLSVQARTDKRLRLWLIGSMTALILLMGVINVVPTNPIVRTIPLLQRLVFVPDHAHTQSLSVRETLWTMALAGIAERPLLGHGAGAVPFVLEQHFDPILLDLERYDAVPDRVHNDTLERLLAGGLLGFAAWLLLACLILRSGWTAFRQTHDPLMLGIVTALIGHFVALLFGFPTIIDLAFIAVLAAAVLRSDPSEMRVHPAIGITVGALLIVVTVFALTDDVRALAADRSFFRWTVTADRMTALPALERASALAPHGGYVPYLATEYIALEQHTDALALLDTTLHHFDRTDATLLALRGWTLLRQGEVSGAQQDFDRAARLAPFSPFVWRTMGTAWMEAKRWEEAIAALEHLLSFSPRYWEWDDSLEDRTAEEQRRYHVFFKQNPDFRTLFLHLAYAEGLLGDEEGAEEARRHAY